MRTSEEEEVLAARFVADASDWQSLVLVLVRSECGGDYRTASGYAVAVGSVGRTVFDGPQCVVEPAAVAMLMDEWGRLVYCPRCNIVSCIAAREKPGLATW
jgi:hypothetical protein